MKRGKKTGAIHFDYKPLIITYFSCCVEGTGSQKHEQEQGLYPQILQQIFSPSVIVSAQFENVFVKYLLLQRNKACRSPDIRFSVFIL